MAQINYERIREHAKTNRWTVTLIAGAVGVSNTTISNLLHGKTEPSSTILKAVCDTIGLPLDEAFIEDNTERATA